MTKEVRVDVTADASKFKKGMTDAEKATSKLHSALDRFGPLGKGAATILEKLGFSSVGSAVGIGVAASALAASVAIAEKAISRYVSLGEKVRHYSEITGQSAEASSRQVIAFQELGVDAETVSASMFRLGRNSSTAADKLAAVGVEVAKNADGSTDLNATLLNVIKAYHSTGDAAQRDLIVFTAFGRAGAAMIPILESNADELKRIEDAIGKVYTAKDLKQIRDYTIAQKQAQESADEWSRSLGQALLPAQKAVYDTLNENVYVQKKLDEAYANGTLNAQAGRGAAMQLAQSYRDEYRAAQHAKVAADNLTASQKAQSEWAKADVDAQNQLYDALNKNIDAGFAYEQALLDLAKAQKDDSDAGGKDAETNLRLREAYERVANAAVAKAAADAEAAGGSLNAEQKAAIYRKELERLITTLSPNSPLRKELQGWIDKLNEIPSVKNTAITTTYRGVNPSGHGNLSFDEGGVVPGPTGAPVPAIVHGGEEVIPVGKRRGGGDVHVHIHGGIFLDDGPSIDRLSNAVAARLTSVTGR